MLSSAASASAAVRGGIPSWELGGGGGSKREGRRRREERRGGESGGGRWCPAKATRGEGRARERGEGGLGIWGDFFFSFFLCSLRFTLSFSRRLVGLVRVFAPAGGEGEGGVHGGPGPRGGAHVEMGGGGVRWWGPWAACSCQ